MSPGWLLLMLLLVGFAAGVQNALAGGGSFLTFPALLLAGIDARAANITSTVALFPGQVTTGLAGRRDVAGGAGLSFAALVGISLAGGVVGALLLLATPPRFFARLVPFLVLFATGVFAWGSFRRRAPESIRIGRLGAAAAQFVIAIYGGYFGGGIGFLMLAALTAAGLTVRAAGATKNALAAVMNAAAVVIFMFSPDVAWARAGVVAVAAIAGGALGNVLDRLRFGAVVDFIHAHIGSVSWYVFNVADAAIVIGVGLLLLDGIAAPARGESARGEKG
jgi:uncharacterized membrane protein YfcA